MYLSYWGAKGSKTPNSEGVLTFLSLKGLLYQFKTHKTSEIGRTCSPCCLLVSWGPQT